MKRMLAIIGAIVLLCMACGVWVLGAADLFSQFDKMNMTDVPALSWVLGAGVFIAALLGWHNRDREFD